MRDEWTKVISGDRLVKFTYVDLQTGAAFMTAQIAGHEVVCSIISEKTEDYSFLVAAPSRQNAQNAPAFTVVVNWQSTLRH